MADAVSGGVRTVIRLEGLCVLVVSLLAYAKFGGSWGIFALCFFVPDLSFLGYLAGPRAGAVSYNSLHSYIGALALLAAGIFLSASVAATAGIIWMAHIGFDRSLGYGLKYQAGFGLTHLGFIGRARTGN
ncbi:ABC-type Na+ efflux pump permease subunit [Rhodanobacter sp. TND4EL1]